MHYLSAPIASLAERLHHEVSSTQGAPPGGAVELVMFWSFLPVVALMIVLSMLLAQSIPVAV